MPENQTVVLENESINDRYDFFVDADETIEDELSTVDIRKFDLKDEDFYLVLTQKRLYYSGDTLYYKGENAKFKKRTGNIAYPDILKIDGTTVKNKKFNIAWILSLIVAVGYMAFGRITGYYGQTERLIYIGLILLAVVFLWMYFGSIKNILIFECKDKEQTVSISTRGVAYKKVMPFKEKLRELMKINKESSAKI